MELETKEIRVIQIEDEPANVDIFKRFFERYRIPLEQVGSKSEFFQLPHLEADLYLLDRHFPDTPEHGPNDRSWREIATALNDMYPERPILLTTGKPPEEGDWRQYKNIKEVVEKPIHDWLDFMQKVRGYLGE